MLAQAILPVLRLICIISSKKEHARKLQLWHLLKPAWYVMITQKKKLWQCQQAKSKLIEHERELNTNRH